MTVRPQVIAHRGASADEPEHTLAAYTEAIQAGADGLECDVRLSADGHLVCVHDRKVQRTSNGRGLVSTLELTQLEGLDWGSWKALERRVERDGTPEDEVPDVVSRDDRAHLLTLRRLLALVAGADRRVEVVVETKHPTRYGGLVERRLVELLSEFGWADDAAGPITVMSFSMLAVRRMRQLAPAIPRVFLMERVPLPFRDGSLPPGVSTAGVAVEILRDHPSYAERVHDRGHRLFVWTVDEPEDVELCLAAGADAIITNRPAEVLAQVGP
ncbi:MAG TPA: glycerophosphodiester phosphodiesterase family protein [Kineosporiaceae bacterium]|nr:glycerophosphodiester phosphodiesterase family protein [Kineosporiaceae bacterium]